MKRTVVIMGVLVALLLAACTTAEPLQKMPSGEEIVEVQTGEYDVTTQVAEPTERDFSNAPAGTWIYPGKVQISGIYPGARAEETISVHNGGATDTVFQIYYEDFASPEEGWAFAPEELGNWLYVSNPEPSIPAGGIVDVLVALELPSGAVIDTEKWGFLVVVSESSQTGMIKVRNASKWLVEMR